jgi:hypothetical protein
MNRTVAIANAASGPTLRRADPPTVKELSPPTFDHANTDSASVVSNVIPAPLNPFVSQ